MNCLQSFRKKKKTVERFAHTAKKAAVQRQVGSAKSFLVFRNQGFLKHLGKIDIVLFGVGVEPCGNRQILSDGFAAVLRGVSVHVQHKNRGKAAGLRLGA